MTINIRNMVCRHCVAAVTEILDRLHIRYRSVSIGHADIQDEPLGEEKLKQLDAALEQSGFERVVNPDDILVEKIKLAVMHHVRDEAECRYNLSSCIEQHIGMPYDTLSRVFSQNQGRTIERYHIAQKVELVKELIGYNEMSLADIAFKVGYSSVAHLSRQFKQETGMTPTQYQHSQNMRAPLNEI